MIRIKYSSAVRVPAGWRQVAVIAQVRMVSKAMAEVVAVDTIDGEKPGYDQSRTGAKRQAFNGLFWAGVEVGKRKRISACTVVTADGSDA